MHDFEKKIIYKCESSIVYLLKTGCDPTFQEGRPDLIKDEKLVGSSR